MPKYAFICDHCVIEFERTLKMSENATHPCPSCAEPAPRLWENVGLAFGFADSPKAEPANTGVHKEDYPTADHIIGKDANKRWEQLDARDKVKKQAREKGGTHALIRHTADTHIDYEPMSTVGRNARRQLAKEALANIRKPKEA